MTDYEAQRRAKAQRREANDERYTGLLKASLKRLSRVDTFDELLEIVREGAGTILREIEANEAAEQRERHL